MNRDFTGSSSYSSTATETNKRSVLLAKFLCPLSAIGGDFSSQDEEVSLLSGFRLVKLKRERPYDTEFIPSLSWLDHFRLHLRQLTNY